MMTIAIATTLISPLEQKSGSRSEEVSKYGLHHVFRYWMPDCYSYPRHYLCRLWHLVLASAVQQGFQCNEPKQQLELSAVFEACRRLRLEFLSLEVRAHLYSTQLYLIASLSYRFVDSHPSWFLSRGRPHRFSLMIPLVASYSASAFKLCSCT